MQTARFAMALLALALLPLTAAAQGTGRIVGRVVDASTGRGIPGAQLAVGGTALRTVSGVDGRYAFSNVPSGARNILATHLGHAPKTVTGVQIADGGASTLDISMQQGSVAVEGITVTAVRERGSVNRALD